MHLKFLSMEKNIITRKKFLKKFTEKPKNVSNVIKQKRCVKELWPRLKCETTCHRMNIEHEINFDFAHCESSDTQKTRRTHVNLRTSIVKKCIFNSFLTQHNNTQVHKIKTNYILSVRLKCSFPFLSCIQSSLSSSQSHMHLCVMTLENRFGHLHLEKNRKTNVNIWIKSIFKIPLLLRYVFGSNTQVRWKYLFLKERNIQMIMLI